MYSNIVIITPITTKLFQQKIDFKNNLSDYSVYRRPVNTSQPAKDVFLASSNIAFNGKPDFIRKIVRSKKDFKDLAVKKQIPCLYCGRKLSYNDGMVDKWKEQGLFSGSVETFVKTITPYKESLHKTEAEVFKIFEYYAKTNPAQKMDSIIKVLSVHSNKELLKAQKPIFDALIKTSKGLPVENQYKLFELIQKSHYRLKRIPHIEEFSGKETSYKIKKLAKTVSNLKSADKIKRLAALLTVPELKERNTPLDASIIEKIKNNIYTNSDIENLHIGVTTHHARKKLYSAILLAIRYEAEKTKRNDIVKLCQEGEKCLQGMPIIGKFSNKSFLYDLEETLEGCNNKNLIIKLHKIAEKLPSSEDNIHAFITKHDNASSETIAVNMLDPSKVTIEHMNPRYYIKLAVSKNNQKSSTQPTYVPDFITDWAISCKRCNNTRQHYDMNEYFKNFDKNNAPNYWKEIISLANEGYFLPEDVKGMLEVFKGQCNIKIDSSALKNSDSI